MEIKLFAGQWSEIEAEALAIVAFEREEESGLGEALAALDEANGGWLTETYGTGEFRGKEMEFCLLHRPAGCRAKRVLLVGAGKKAACTVDLLRKAGGAAVRELKSRRIQQVAFALPEGAMRPEQAKAVVEGAVLGNFEPDKFKTDRDEAKRCLSFTVVAREAGEQVSAAVEKGRIIGECQNFTRDLVNEPGNLLTPERLAAKAREMAGECGLECETLDRERMKQLGMGALLGVAQGSAEPPVMIILRYRPEGECAGSDHLALIGKGVTFDTGGISIKPSESMEKMKYDMAGAGATLGAMRALAALKPRIPVTAYIPAVENMPGSRAQRPGDIVTSLAGKTIEVINTDAEGRLILIDAITYAKRQGCTHLVDAATLTGAIAVALGFINVGVFSNHEGFAQQFLEAAKAAGEKMWPMPLDPEYQELLKNPFADLSNIGGRWGGAISAAYFLKEFAEDTPWIHLDIAGTAWLEEGKADLAKGASGVGVRTFVELALSWS